MSERRAFGQALHRVPDLRAFLTGSWVIRRRLDDRRLARRGCFEGQAVFSPADEAGLAYREVGRLVLPGFETAAHQCYHYLFPASFCADVQFSDGRAFHRLDLRSGLWSAEHRCAEDLYRGRFRVAGPSDWSVVWTVTGPRKDQRLTSRFTRAS